MIYHLTTPIEWQLAQERGSYSAPSLDSEGFIHCSSREQIIPVANAFYAHEEMLVVLCIDETKLQPVVKWEAPAHPEGHEPPENADEQLFPHVFGVINLDAVDAFHSLPKNEDGYHLPENM